MIPMAKAFGLRVITTVLGEDKVNEVAYLNADRVVDTTKEDIAEVLKEEEKNGTPVNILSNLVNIENGIVVQL